MRFFYGFFVFLLLNTNIFAAKEPDITLQGSFTQVITNTTAHPHHAATKTKNTSPQKTIALTRMKLSESAWDALATRAKAIQQHPVLNKTKLQKNQAQKQLGMNDVPVLDQGSYGTCATFAVTAALDALIHSSDHISQLCLLQLGQYLEDFGYNPSGWDGSLTSLVLSQIDAFGIVDKATEATSGCGEGQTAYPPQNPIPDEGISLEAYHAISTPLSDNGIAWSSLLDWHLTFQNRPKPQQLLNAVKTSLIAGDRLTFGVLLFNPNQGVVGAIGTHTVSHDTWVLTPEIIQSILGHRDNYGGHAMIVTGFDDTATAIDTDGHTHQGLFTLRNAWGAKSGNHGDFYMSYDYFSLLATEIERIRPLPLGHDLTR